MHTDRSEEILLRVATAVVDDEAIDWERESATEADVQRKVHNLRLLQSIGEAHRYVREEVLETHALAATHGSTWGKLELRQQLGTGHFGEVYRAWDPDLRCEVALKLPSSDTINGGDQGHRFLREARQLAKVKHEHVVRVLGAETHEGRVGIWTELIEGRTLEELLRHEGRLSADEATLIGIDLCRALAAVHGAGLIHRDVKTSNVLREEGGRIVLLDFGVAADRLPDADLADVGSISGTPRFMAPEQFRGEPASVRSDLYSLGVVLYRLVTVSYPIEATTLEDLAKRGGVTPLRDRRPDLPGPFVEVVERLLVATPGERYSSAGEVEQALKVTRGAWTAANGAPGSRAPRRTKPWLAVATAAMLILAAAAYVFWPSPLEVDLVFYRLDATNLPRPIEEEAPLKLGDRLYFDVETSRDAHLYVISEDLAGRTRRLFPSPDFALSNPLRPRQRYTIPGTVDGILHYWRMDSVSDAEFFLVVVADRSLQEIETLLGNLPTVKLGPDDSEPQQKRRGFGRAEPAPGIKPDGPRILPSLTSDLAVLSARDRGVWYQEFRFQGARDD